MVTCKGTVKDDVVVLENGALFPNGALVEVKLIESVTTREAAFARVLAQRAANAKYRVGMDEIIEEEKRERDAYEDERMA